MSTKGNWKISEHRAWVKGRLGEQRQRDWMIDRALCEFEHVENLGYEHALEALVIGLSEQRIALHKAMDLALGATAAGSGSAHSGGFCASAATLPAPARPEGKG